MTLTELAAKHNIKPDSAMAFLREWLDANPTLLWSLSIKKQTVNADGRKVDFNQLIDVSHSREILDKHAYSLAGKDISITPLIARPTLGE